MSQSNLPACRLQLRTHDASMSKPPACMPPSQVVKLSLGLRRKPLRALLLCITGAVSVGQLPTRELPALFRYTIAAAHQGAACPVD